MPLHSYSGDQFGYYSVGDRFRTYFKLLAIEEAKRTNQPLRWNFNPETYGRYDWTLEPKDDLLELYRRRAQEIRDSYDYVVLWYSGGADSWNILNTFLRNNIKIDEIAQFHTYEGDKDRNSDMNAEIFSTSIPHTQKIVEQMPWIKHRVLDISELIVNTFQRVDMRFEFPYRVKFLAGANTVSRAYVRDWVDDYRHMIDSGKKLCFVMGVEKPRLISDTADGRYHLMLVDDTNETNARVQEMAGQGYFDEWFYWGANSMDILAKQCHLLMRVMDSLPATSPWLTAQPEAVWLPKSRRHQRYLTTDAFHELIYPGWQRPEVLSPKACNLLIGYRDNWLWSQNHGSNRYVNNAWTGIEELVKRTGPEYWRDPKDPNNGIMQMKNFYALEPPVQ